MDTSNMVFVFGSNRSGIHGAGAAYQAHRFKRAEWGVGEGPTGSCYALPTKGYNITEISLDDVAYNIQTFVIYAQNNPHDNFQVTQVGCGLGGFTKEQIAPLFIFAPENCYFDKAWKDLMPLSFQFWGSF